MYCTINKGGPLEQAKERAKPQYRSGTKVTDYQVSRVSATVGIGRPRAFSTNKESLNLLERRTMVVILSKYAIFMRTYQSVVMY